MSNAQIQKALSIQQPWADATLYLGKTVENRTWKPTSALIGQTAVGAGQPPQGDSPRESRRKTAPCGIVCYPSG